MAKIYPTWKKRQFHGMRYPRFVKGYPTRTTKMIRRRKRGGVKREFLRQARPRIHARGPRGVRTRFDEQQALEDRATKKVIGSLEERIVFQALEDHGLISGVDFDFQSNEFGGRAELGGIVADIMFPYPKVIVQVQSYWHRLDSSIIRRDLDQAAMLQSIGYIVLELWPNTIHDAAALDLWIENNLMHLWGTSKGPLVGGVDRDDVFLDFHLGVLTRIEYNLDDMLNGR